MEFKELQRKKAKEIDDILRRYLPAPAGDQAVCMEDMAYSVLGGGKRLRPMLMRETCALFAEDTSVAEPFMAAIEMIHTYSLIHDDIMDDDDERRGRPTIHAKYREMFSTRHAEEAGRDSAGESWKYGASMGILAGDALLTYAFEIMADAAGQESEAALPVRPGQSAEPGAKDAEQTRENAGSSAENAALVEGRMARAAAKIRAMSLIAKKAGVYGMVGGQVIDVQNVGTDMTAEQVKNINELKTSALIEASMMAGAILGGADDASVGNIGRAASMIGQAFQIEDDILDVTGNAADLGKPVGSDDKNDKNTYVRIYGLEECGRMVAELSEEAIRILQSCNFRREPDGFLEELLRSLVNRDR
ncbi:MAG: polyprenyl synthetase family protein [Lachnospiraceae bacterium]|nr:polyprenyl synthetase family protein [Lachnospiraceae bacterium]